MQPEVTEECSGRQGVAGERSRLRREHDLAAVADRRHPRRPVDIDADRSGRCLGRFSGVDAHPDPHLLAGGPALGAKSQLHLDHRRHTGDRRGEDGEEPVALGADLGPVVRREARSDEGVVLGEDLGVGVAAEATQ